MTYNYHTHTYRCSHATGTEEEYILRAIDCGVTHMGFSDHIPYMFPGGYESFFRVPTAKAEEYFSTLKGLREKYRGQIDLKIGFEMEYYPLHFHTMLRQALNWGCEYLILGQHFIDNERPGSPHVFVPTDSEAALREYADCVLAAMESGVFTYVAHPDIFCFCGSEDVYCREMRRICAASL